jgi:hypothetical protein
MFQWALIGQSHSNRQTVMNDLQKIRLSRHRKIWLLPHPLHPLPSPVSKRWATHRKIGKDRQHADERGEGLEPNHTTMRTPGRRTTENPQLEPGIRLGDVSKLLASYAVIRDGILIV